MSYSALATLLRSTAAKLASLPQSVAAFLAADETPLESVPEPYVPTTTSSVDEPNSGAAETPSSSTAAATAAVATATATAAAGLPQPPEESPPPSSGSMPGTLRERATGGANPSLLGDPVSLKAEQSSLVPTPDEAGAPPSSSSSPSSSSPTATHKESLREKAAKAVHGPDANPSMLGDPISMTSEAGGVANREVEEGAMARRGSKL